MGSTTNLVTNPSWETNTTGWTANNLATYSRSVGAARFGSAMGYISDTVSASDEYLYSEAITVTVGTVYTASVYIKKTVVDASYTGEFRIYWYTAGGAFISANTYVLPSGNITNWARITLTATAPATAASARLLFYDLGIVAGVWAMWIDGVQFEAQPAATAYCDGDQPGCSWSGTAHASTSSRVAGADYTTITITDGTTTLTLTDGRNYALVDGGWAPNVAALRLSTLGGSGPYEDVDEDLTLNVLGETGVEVLFNLGELSRMLDQAERWSRGEPVSAVLFTYQPQGSVLSAALSCVILGRSGKMAINTPATFNDLLMCYEIANVQISFRRRGLWLEAVEALSATGAVTNPNPATATFASTATVASPAKITISFPLSTGVDFSPVLLWANSENRIFILDAEDMATGPFTVVDDSTKEAYGDDILRYTPVSTAASNTGLLSATWPTSNWQRIAMWALVRNNSASATWMIRARVACGYTASEAIIASPFVPVDASSLQPRPIFLGTIAIPQGPLAIGLSISASTTTGPPTLDVDYLALLDVSDEMAGSIVVGCALTGSSITVNSQPLTKPSSAVTKIISGVTAPLSYSGDGFVALSGSKLAVAYLAPMGPNWRLSSGGTPFTFTLTASRWKARTTPE